MFIYIDNSWYIFIYMLLKLAAIKENIKLFLEGLKYFREVFSNYFSENHTIVMGINTEKKKKILKDLKKTKSTSLSI